MRKDTTHAVDTRTLGRMVDWVTPQRITGMVPVHWVAINPPTGIRRTREERYREHAKGQSRSPVCSVLWTGSGPTLMSILQGVHITELPAERDGASRAFDVRLLTMLMYSLVDLRSDKFTSVKIVLPLLPQPTVSSTQVSNPRVDAIRP